MCTPEAWRGGVARSPSHESVTTDLSLFSVSSAASDARVLRLLACKAGQGPDPSLRVASPNPDSKALKRPSSSSLPLQSTDNCRELLAGCAALCAQLGLRRSFSAADVAHCRDSCQPLRSATSEVGLCAALEALTLSAASRSCSTWVAVGGSQLPSPQRSHPAQPTQRQLPTDNKKVRQSYIKRRLLTTYRALERMSQSDFNLDRLEVRRDATELSGGGGERGVARARPPHAGRAAAPAGARRAPRGRAPRAHGRGPGARARPAAVQVRAQHDDLQLAAHARRRRALLDHSTRLAQRSGAPPGTGWISDAVLTSECGLQSLKKLRRVLRTISCTVFLSHALYLW